MIGDRDGHVARPGVEDFSYVKHTYSGRWHWRVDYLQSARFALVYTGDGFVHVGYVDVLFTRRLFLFDVRAIKRVTFLPRVQSVVEDLLLCFTALSLALLAYWISARCVVLRHDSSTAWLLSRVHELYTRLLLLRVSIWVIL